MMIRPVVLAMALVLFLAACGGSDESQAVNAPDPDTQSGVVEDAAENPEDFVDDIVDGLEAAQAAQGGGSVTLTVGDQTWTFDRILCAFGEDQIGQEGAVFNASSIQDGLQMYFSIDSFGQSASLNDIEDFENPSVALGSAFGEGEFINLDGKIFSGTAEFRDETSDSFETMPGSFSGTCP